MDPLATVDVRQDHEIALAQVRGEIDTSNVQEVETALGAAGARPGTGLVVDFSAVTYMNSAVIQLLFELSEQLRARQQQLRLVMNETAPMHRLFAMLRFDLVVPVHNTLEDALAQMRTGPTAGG